MLKTELVKGAARDASPEVTRGVEEIYHLWKVMFDKSSDNLMEMTNVFIEHENITHI